MRPLVSIITVCYNSQKHIEQTITSVLNQTYTNIEYILVDGQSTDNTLAIIDKYARQHSNDIRYVSEADTGIYNAMNKGIKMAKGELIGIINSDDWYEQTAVETAVKAYEQHGAAVYHGFQRTIQEDDEVFIIRTNANMLWKTMIEHPTCFIPKSIYEKYGYYDEKYKLVSDYALMIYLKANNVCFIPTDNIVANFRRGGASRGKEAEIENLQFWNDIGTISNKELKLRIAAIKTKKIIRKIADRLIAYRPKDLGENLGN